VYGICTLEKIIDNLISTKDSLVEYFRKEIGNMQIMSLGIEVSIFVLSPEIEDRDEVEVGNWAKHKKTFYPE
jgi:hypothetical protein